MKWRAPCNASSANTNSAMGRLNTRTDALDTSAVSGRSRFASPPTGIITRSSAGSALPPPSSNPGTASVLISVVRRSRGTPRSSRTGPRQRRVARDRGARSRGRPDLGGLPRSSVVFPDHPTIDSKGGVRNRLPSVRQSNLLVSRLANPVGVARVPQDRTDTGSERIRRRRHDHAASIVAHDLPQSSGARGDHRSPGGHRLQSHNPERLLQLPHHPNIPPFKK